MTTKAREKTSAWTPQRERRPFLWLEAIDVPPKLPPSATDGLKLLAELMMDGVGFLVRSLVNHTVAAQNERRRREGRALGVSVSVLNRRRRAARSWIVAILRGQVDRGTLHDVAHSWVPQLCGTGPNIRNANRPARSYFEFLRGLMTAHVMHRVADNLVPEAKALHALETILGIHLRALQDAVNAELSQDLNV
ncbi:MAG: hypothetical protein ACYTGW_00875 [Planctomycetota bacterium]|jgi:hypothetical protein